jgi:hypothetical protein
VQARLRQNATIAGFIAPRATQLVVPQNSSASLSPRIAELISPRATQRRRSAELISLLSAAHELH